MVRGFFAVWIALTPTAFAEGYLITNIKIISPANGGVRTNQAVRVVGDRIVKVGPSAKIRPNKNDKIVDGKGQFALPGLIDGHVHLGSIPSFRADHAEQFPEIKKEYEAQVLRSYLYFGFTTLIDLAVVDRDLINRLKRQKLRPQIFDCDSPLVLANGYPMSFLPKKFRFKRFKNFVFDPRQKGQIPKKYKPENHTPEAAIKRVKDSGAVCIKAHHESGFSGETLPTPSQDLFKAIVRGAKKSGLPLLVHANSFASQKFAHANGAKIFVHGMWNWPGSKTKKRRMPKVATELVKQIVKSGVQTMPTVQVLKGNQNMFDPKYLQRADVKRVIPKSLFDWYQNEKGLWFKGVIAKVLKDVPGKDAFRKYEPIVDRGRQAAQAIAKHNGKLLFGSDTPASPTFGNLPGLNGFDELRELERAGFSPLRVIQAATIHNAKVFGIEHKVGSIAPGKIANFLLLKNNPLGSLENLKTITTVVARGMVSARADLAANAH